MLWAHPVVQTGDTLTLTYFGSWLYGQEDGPFAAHAASGSSFDSFATFCVEPDELVEVGTPFNPNSPVYQISEIGLKNSSGRELSGYTAWLYTSFLDGTLAQMYGYEDGTAAGRNQLQRAISYSMGYTADGEDNSLWRDAYDQFVAANPTWGIGQVRIAQLVRFDNGAKAQDILILAPSPCTLLLLLVGLTMSVPRRRLATA